jgi:hypothetical protein
LKKITGSRLHGPQNQFHPDFARIGIIFFSPKNRLSKTLISQQKNPP